MKGRLLLIAAFAFVAVLATTSNANAGTNVSNTNISVTCTSTGQECDQWHERTVSTSWVLTLEFESAFNGCGSFSVTFVVDGTPVFTSPVLAPFQRSGVVDLTPVAAGPHTIEVHATGVPGGCNTGTLTSWGGRLIITTNDDPPPVPEPEPEPEGNQPSSKDDCKGLGWQAFSEPSFQSQGLCVKWVETQKASGSPANNNKK